MTKNTRSLHEFDAEQVYHAINTLFRLGEVFEIRGIAGSYNFSGYFTSATDAINALQNFTCGYRKEETARTANIFITLNPCSNDCYSRKQSNRFIESVQPTTKDEEIAYLRHFFIDLDPIRTTGVSSSDDELNIAIHKADGIMAYLAELGFKSPIIAMSGNGVHLLYRFNDIPNTAENVDIWKNALNFLADKFSDDKVDIDRKVFNPARICKLWGTFAQKGSDTPARPHRQSYIQNIPQPFETNDISLLQILAKKSEKSTNIQPVAPQKNVKINKKSDNKTFNIDDFISNHNIPVRSTETRKDGTYYILEHCLFDPAHAGKDAAIIQRNDSTICYNCFHNSCSDRHWRDVRLMFEPDAYDEKPTKKRKPRTRVISDKCPFIEITDKGECVNTVLLANYVRQHFKFFRIKPANSDDYRRFIYENGVYRYISDEEFKGYIKQPIIQYNELLLKMSVVREVFENLNSDLDTFHVNEQMLNADENIINFRNGILKLDTMELVPHSTEYYSTIQLPVEYNPKNISTPVFDRFIGELTSNNAEKKQCILEFMGACLSNVYGYRFKKALFMVGKGNTGKSVLRNLINRLLGTTNVSGGSLADLEERFGKSNIYNKRVYGSPDLGCISVAQLETFKNITGGDVIPVERKSKDPFEYQYRGLVWFGCNAMPRFGGDRGDWVYDRMLMVKCDNVIPEEQRDSLLVDKLMKEASGIIYKALTALKTAIERGYRFISPKDSTESMSRYKAENSPYLRFYQECCVPRPKNGRFDSVTRPVLHKYLKLWCSENTGKLMPKTQDFVLELENAGIDMSVGIYKGSRYYNSFTLSLEMKKYYHHVDSVEIIDND